MFTETAYEAFMKLKQVRRRSWGGTIYIYIPYAYMYNIYIYIAIYTHPHNILLKLPKGEV